MAGSQSVIDRAALRDRMCVVMDEPGMRRFVADTYPSLVDRLPGGTVSPVELAHAIVDLVSRTEGSHAELARMVLAMRSSSSQSSRAGTPRHPSRRGTASVRGALVSGVLAGGALVTASMVIPPPSSAAPNALVGPEEVAPDEGPAILGVHIPVMPSPAREGAKRSRRSPGPRQPDPAIVAPAEALAGAAKCEPDGVCELTAENGVFTAPISACLDVHVEGVQVKCMVSDDLRDVSSSRCARSDRAQDYPLAEGTYRWRQCK
jgi:hypothetical protein